MPSLHEPLRVLLIGVGATAVMDLWLLALARLGIQAADWALVGRWVGHLAQGRVAHESISAAAPFPHERLLGWLTHYVVGIAYAGLLVALQGVGWARAPTLLPALAIGLATIVVPMFIMHPAMGNGFAASKSPAPLKTSARTLANHAAFGVGLFVAALALQRVW